MRADKSKLEMVMARECMRLSDIAKKAKMPEPSVKNVLYGRSVKPCTFGKVCKALNIDPIEIIAKED
mgnify:CR=1 FL=1